MTLTNCNVISLIVCAGTFGGLVNFAQARTKESTWRDGCWSVVIGLGAAFLIPLFLNTISSSLLAGLLNGTAGSADPFVFFGFCLLGAISSKSMIQSLSQKVLRLAEETKRDVKNLKDEVKPIIDKETEPDQHKSNESAFRVEAYGLTGDDASKVIKALGDSKYSRRTVQGISKDANIAEGTVIETLRWLQQNGLATTTGGPRHYWSLTDKGRSAFAEISSLRN
ncbi:YEATS-associated helix-containing protein [Pseudoduganella violaceinigra]|uniref:YEATS-associated helix-containing protein n=1 Tax=Pseudoduganella violaceinigra TaxID=246602 RepID=UPI0012B56D9A|nr:YEATS-associated helix-containing protein [Pseudoduganella violaceinigra]